ncbi:uncharacterized protein LOC135496491 [Lineus longissimus]|uniref:uncharacterized protein LOC135496491 n=1 Tax=Lineus longissimus TaxID=88925 RepID=UPI00315D3E23
MPLPFKGSDPVMPNNKAAVMNRLNQIKAKFKANPQYKEHYVEFMRKIIDDGDAERVSPVDVRSDRGRVWYLPHFAVYHPKKPTKVRVVFDCSAKYSGQSLNDHLLQGPDMVNSLMGVLCRFRQEQVAVTCDVERMFHQFKVNEEHRNYLRFLWWPNGDVDSEPAEYRMNVHLFGARSSPGCCSFGLKRIAQDNEQELGTEAADFIRHNFYVDDGLKSITTDEQGITLVQSSQAMCANGGLRLHKIASNSSQVLRSVPENDRSQKDSELPVSINGTGYPIERALGVYWCIEADTFEFRITLKDNPLTRRGVLSTIGSIYDPLGIAAPVLLVGKQILQDLCRENADWDTPLEEGLRTRWECWRDELPMLEKIAVSRCHKPKNFGEVKCIELHHLSDASSTGYGQCSYVRMVNARDEVHCSFVMGKARVAPLKPVTIPRLELTAALVSVKVSAMLQKEMDYMIDSETFWTDSKVVLGYIENEARRFHVFVANRVQEIRDHTDPKQWRHVPGIENVADEASRGLRAEQLANGTAGWLKGPRFLWQQELPPKPTRDAESTLQSDDPEVRKVHTLKTTKVSFASTAERMSRFSSWFKAKSAVATCLNCRKHLLTRSRKQDATVENALRLKAEDIEEAEKVIIKAVQAEAFRDEITTLKQLQAEDVTGGARHGIKASSPLYRLDPFIDEEGIVRVGGRIGKANYALAIKHPVILPRVSSTSR